MLPMANLGELRASWGQPLKGKLGSRASWGQPLNIKYCIADRAISGVTPWLAPLRIQYEGGPCHATLRGNERKTIVRDDGDRRRFVDSLGASVLRHGVILHLYRLMDNGARDRIPIGNSIF